ncbi:MAG: transcriptional regulator, partial [Xanthomonadaceae bacterium]|nr:transcriptional regulator [Xanthomonadaceae bacterium]
MSTALVILRSERDRMSAIERRIADFILENAHLLRDYSSQQLANALGISQSSVVKFCQKLGFKGYPDLKLAISEAVIRADSNGGTPLLPEGTPAVAAQGYDLWLRKSEAEEATRLINPPGTLTAVAETLGHAGTVFIVGMGEDDLHARALALRLAQLGILTVHNFDAAHMTASLSAAKPNDVLLAFSEHGL